MIRAFMMRKLLLTGAAFFVCCSCCSVGSDDIALWYDDMMVRHQAEERQKWKRPQITQISADYPEEEKRALGRGMDDPDGWGVA